MKNYKKIFLNKYVITFSLVVIALVSINYYVEYRLKKEAKVIIEKVETVNELLNDEQKVDSLATKVGEQAAITKKRAKKLWSNIKEGYNKKEKED